MTRKEFLQLPEYDQKIFIAKLLTAVKQNDDAFKHAEYVIVMAEKEGKYKVRFGNEVYRDAAIIKE